MIRHFALAALLAASTAHAQDIKGPVKLIVGYPAGGSADVVARLVADKIKDDLKQSVVVENRVGAGGRVATYVFTTNLVASENLFALWLALGDFNAHDAAGEEYLRPLTHNFAVDLCAHMPADERWTYFQPWTGGYSCPDRLFASPALAERCEGAPTILKSGLGRAPRAHAGPRLDGVGETRPHASDHALLMIDLDI